jgi:hypothetical protein
MPIDVTVTLDQLDCSTQAHGGVIGVSDTFARVVVKPDMKSGDTAPVPNALRSFSARFDDKLAMSHVVGVAVLMEEDAAPEAQASVRMAPGALALEQRWRWRMRPIRTGDGIPTPTGVAFFC